MVLMYGLLQKDYRRFEGVFFTGGLGAAVFKRRLLLAGKSAVPGDSGLGADDQPAGGALRLAELSSGLPAGDSFHAEKLCPQI